MRKIWDIFKSLVIALVIAISFDKNFSYGVLLGIGDPKAAWLLNIAIHTAFLNIIFFLIESLIEKNKVSIESFLYFEKEFKENSDYMLLKMSSISENSFKEIYWYIKVDGKRYLLPKYIKLTYTEDLTLQISRKGQKYIKINDKKNQIKINLRGFLPHESHLDNQEKTFPITIVLDEDNSLVDSYNLKPKCLRINPFVRLKTRNFNIKVKEE